MWEKKCVWMNNIGFHKAIWVTVHGAWKWAKITQILLQNKRNNIYYDFV